MCPYSAANISHSGLGKKVSSNRAKHDISAPEIVLTWHSARRLCTCRFDLTEATRRPLDQCVEVCNQNGNALLCLRHREHHTGSGSSGSRSRPPASDSGTSQPWRVSMQGAAQRLIGDQPWLCVRAVEVKMRRKTCRVVSQSTSPSAAEAQGSTSISALQSTWIMEHFLAAVASLCIAHDVCTYGGICCGQRSCTAQAYVFVFPVCLVCVRVLATACSLEGSHRW